jgi:hypothetical protein
LSKARAMKAVVWRGRDVMDAKHPPTGALQALPGFPGLYGRVEKARETIDHIVFRRKVQDDPSHIAFVVEIYVPKDWATTWRDVKALYTHPIDILIPEDMARKPS